MSHYNAQREADDIWKSAPEGAEFFNEYEGNYYSIKDGRVIFFDAENETWERSIYSVDGLLNKKSTVNRPQTHTKTHQGEPAPLKPQNPYQRTIIGLDGSKCVVDVYRVLDAFKTDSPALDHAVKKILCPGTRHAKTREQDLREAIASIEAELLLMSQR